MRTRIGLERISEYDRLFSGKRIGLITNFTGILPDLSADAIEVFRQEGYVVEKIFTPEHGLYGADAGESVSDSVHPAYKIPVISLYGTHRVPTDVDLEGIDLLVYDIQDAGLRYYTYIYTMCYALEAAGKKGLPFVILDRPNPLGCAVSGYRMDAAVHSFVGDYRLPMRYGLTVGELAGYWMQFAGVKAELTVIPMEYYSRSMCYPDTGLLWNIPSPALPSFESVLCYHGGCMYEAVTVSEGRGSSRPFQMYGAPYINMDKLFKDVKEQWKDSSIVFRRRTFVPYVGKFRGELCYGLEFLPVSGKCDFLPLALITLKAILDRYPEQVKLTEQEEKTALNHLELLFGSSRITDYLQGGCALKTLREEWEAQAQAFVQETREFWLYPDDFKLL